MGAMAALYMTKRRLTTMDPATATHAGAPAASSPNAAVCPAPAKTSTDMATPSSGVRPASTASAPTARPKGMTPISSGTAAASPVRAARVTEDGEAAASGVPAYRLVSPLADDRVGLVGTLPVYIDADGLPAQALQ